MTFAELRDFLLSEHFVEEPKEASEIAESFGFSKITKTGSIVLSVLTDTEDYILSFNCGEVVGDLMGKGFERLCFEVEISDVVVSVIPDKGISLYRAAMEGFFQNFYLLPSGQVSYPLFLKGFFSHIAPVKGVKDSVYLLFFKEEDKCYGIAPKSGGLVKFLPRKDWPNFNSFEENYA